MSGIPPDLYQRLYQTLLDCGPFESYAALEAIFVDSRIEQWRDVLPEASNKADRVRRTIAVLSQRKNSDGDNALVLLLEVLRDLIPHNDAHQKDLKELRDELTKLALDTSFIPLPGGTPYVMRYLIPALVIVALVIIAWLNRAAIFGSSTAVPPTDSPTPVLTVATLTPSLTATPVPPSATSTQAPTSTPTPTETPTSTPSPSPTFTQTPSPTLTSSPPQPASPTTPLNFLVEGFENYRDAWLADSFTINKNAGNEASLSVVGIPHVNQGSRALAFNYEIRHPAPNHYIGFGASFPTQDWSSYAQLCVWIESDNSNRDLIIQFGENEAKFLKPEPLHSLSEGTGDYCVPLYPPGIIDLGRISYYGVYVEGTQGQSLIYIDNVQLK